MKFPIDRIYSHLDRFKKRFHLLKSIKDFSVLQLIQQLSVEAPHATQIVPAHDIKGQGMEIF